MTVMLGSCIPRSTGSNYSSNNSSRESPTTSSCQLFMYFTNCVYLYRPRNMKAGAKRNPYSLKAADRPAGEASSTAVVALSTAR